MPASPSTARAINDRLALRLLQQEGPLTAGQLKQLTGLSRPTVADLVERLIAADLIEVVGESGEQRRGPNAKLYGIVADLAYLAALDVRTEGVSVLVSDLLGHVLAEASVPIGDDTGTGPAVEQAVTLVERTAKEAGVDRLHTVGIGAPGLIDPVTGELRNSTGLPEWHRRLVAALQERLPEARIHVENETNLAALAEQRDGAARDRDTFVLLWLGHGTGAAVVLDGALRRGPPGDGGDRVPAGAGDAGAALGDGVRRGFHSLAGSAAIVELAGEYGVTGAAAGSEPAGSEPVAAVLVGRAVAEEANGFLDVLADRLAVGVSSVVAVLDPGCVVLGGEVGQAGGEELAARVEQRVRRMSPLPTEVRSSALGGGAVLRGALLTARDRAQDELFAPPER